MKAYKVENQKAVIYEAERPSGKLIETKAIGVNRADVFYCQGKYPVFGLEFAGVLEGKRVCGLVDGGAYAEFISANKASYVEIPEGMRFEDAAANVESLITAYYNLVELCNLQKGEKLLIHGGGSGLGVVAIQLAKLLGAEVFATAGKQKKLELIESLGATAIDYRKDDFSNNEYDVILDMVGGDYFNRNLSALKYGGRLAIIAFIGGAKTDANLAPILLKNLSIYGSTIRSLKAEYKADLAKKILPFMDKIEAIIDKVFTFEQTAEAIAYVEGYENAGKVILRMDH